MKKKQEHKASHVSDDHALDFGIWGKWTDKSIQDNFEWFPASAIIRLPEGLRELREELSKRRLKILNLRMKKMETFGDFQLVMEDFSAIERQFNKLNELEKYAEVVLRPRGKDEKK